VDIYDDLAGFLNVALPVLGVEGQAVCGSLLEPMTELQQEFDLALVLKTLPCLEQLRKGAGLMLLHSIHARHIAVSYPTKSLGGRSKGMEEFYEAQFAGLLRETGWSAVRMAFANETVYIVQKDG